MPTDDVVQTPFGAFLIPKGDLIGETLRAGTCWDGPGFLQVIAQEHGRLDQPAMQYTILDVGANLGAFTIWLASRGAWRVVAVEPVPETMRYLKASLDLNKASCADRVVTLGVAGYDRATTLVVPLPLDRGNLGGTALRPWKDPEVQHAHVGQNLSAVPLDDFDWLWERGLSLIKIDAQGCDGRVILGLAESIQRWHPAIVYEWESELAEAHGLPFRQVHAQLVAWGYRVEEWPSHPHNYLAVWQGAK